MFVATEIGVTVPLNWLVTKAVAPSGPIATYRGATPTEPWRTSRRSRTLGIEERRADSPRPPRR